MNERDIFIQVIQAKDSGESAALIQQLCGEDQELRKRVDMLLEAHGRAVDFLESPAVPLPPTIEQPEIERPGMQIGPYKLLQEIGHGGMGMVFMAEQHEPVRRKVALKIIKPGMDSRQVLARFEAERQALSLMDHPNIAKVLDAGTTSSGRPYFVMELVKGQPITQYCDENKLTPRQRLELLLPVCQAIQHAHQKGIIHRDIKPSNILVAEYDQKPVPKVIDFGVAKAISQPLTDRTMFTGFGQVVGTLEYMSPEQAKVNQLDIDTRSDIYSLGVLMYELLTGTTPFDRKRLKQAAWDEMLRIIREEEPPKPSTRLSDSIDSLPSISAQRHMEPAKLTKMVRGELDWIVMKALEKDRSRRYETANGLAMDLQRYLADEAVQAGPASAAYRLRKFMRRNMGLLAVATLVLFFLVLIGGGIGWVVRDRLARQAKVAGQVELILGEVDRLESEQKWHEALVAARRAAAVVASGEADEVTSQQVHLLIKDIEFIDRLEQIRMQMATWIEGKVDYAGADREYSRAFRDHGVDVEVLDVEAAIKRLKTRSILAVPLAAALDAWASARWGSHWNADATKRLITVARGIDPDPLRDRIRAALLRPASEVGDDLPRLAESIDMRSSHPATLDLLVRTLKQVIDPTAAVRLQRDAQRAHPGDFWLNFGLAYFLQEQKDYDGAVRFYTAAVSIRPHAIGALNNLGNALKNQKKLDEAIATYRKAIELDSRFAIGLRNLGITLRAQKKLDEAIAVHHKAIEVDPKFAPTYHDLGLALSDQKNLDEAIAAYRKAIEVDPKYAPAYYDLGLALRSQKKLDEAIAANRKAIEVDPNYANAYHCLGLALYDQKKLDEAIAAYRKAIELNPEYAGTYFNLGHALYTQKKLNEAIAAYRKYIDFDPKYAPAHNNLGSALSDQKQLDAAIASFRKAIEVDPKYAPAYFNLGKTLNAQMKQDEAITALRKAIELVPNNAATYLVLGNALSAQKKMDEAIAAYRKAIELNPKFTQAHNNLGGALSDQKQLDAAIASYRKAIELDPKYAPAHFNLGNALFAQKKLDDAMTAYRMSIELVPNYAGAYIGFGNVLRDQKKMDEAIAAYRKAIELAPNNSIAHYNLGDLMCDELKDYPAAIECLHKAIELDSKYISAYISLAIALRGQGKLDEALNANRKAVDLDPQNADSRRRLVLALNNWALSLATDPDPQKRDHVRATKMAKEAVELAPSNGDCLHTLGVASYRAGEWKAAIASLEKSIELRKGGDCNDWFFLAMAHGKLGHRDEARKAYEQAIQWMEKKQEVLAKNKGLTEVLRRLRVEAEEILELKKR